MLVSGLFLAFVTNAVLANLISDSVVWRYMLGIALLPALALLLGMLTLPDTPRWYASKQMWPQAKQTLLRAHTPRTESTRNTSRSQPSSRPTTSPARSPRSPRCEASPG